MPRKLAHVTADILETIARVEEITRGRSFQEFATSWQLRWMVQRALEIISEASRAIPDEVANTRPEIPWRKVRDIGNVLRHEYEGISDRLIWNVVVDELPPLKAAVQAIAATEKPQ
ncbi:MAG TPA: HepT-like ribonuclease domain-containing protein [Xanthobacteraceae bacterium]|nr:HepT-like ribonuclease domain-containing protein [Xanthobacteraceae bacterium]